MTTLVFDGDTLAADSRAIDNYINDRFEKIYQVGSIYYALCGRATTALAFIQWARNKTGTKPKLDDDFSVLMIRDGKPYEIDHNYVELPLKAPCALGTGAPFAMAAMLCGKDAKGAVEIAKKLDENTGGKIKTVKIK